MHHNIKKEKCELNILSANSGTRNKFINKGANVPRPDSLEIKVKPDNVVNIISKSDTYLENINSWSGDSLDNFILQIKNVNNTPSPITPNSFFNPSDVTQDQEQFADALTMHLNKIKEDYKSNIDINDSQYLNNIIQISSINQEKPIPIGTVSLGNKVFLLNQISHNLDSNDNQCVNYGIMNLPGNILQQNSNTIIHQPMKISQFQSLRTTAGESAILCSGQNLQFASYTHQDNEELNNMISINGDVSHSHSNNVNQQAQHNNFLKTSEGVIYTRVPDSSQNELLNQLNSIAGNVSCNNSIINTNVVKTVGVIDRDLRSLSASSNDNDSSYGTNDSSVKTQQKDYSSNNSKLLHNDERDLDDMHRRLERKRARNRDAARKCRDRKNSLITTLEQKYARQTAEKELIRDKLIKSLEEIRRLTEYISKHDPHSKFANFSNFLNEIKIHELTETDLKDLNLM